MLPASVQNENLRRRRRTNLCFLFSLQEDHDRGKPLALGVSNVCANSLAWLPNIGASGGKQIQAWPQALTVGCILSLTTSTMGWFTIPFV